MVKWKKMNKKMAGIMLGVMMLFTASTTAFAYVDESAEASKTEVTQTEQTVSQEEAQTEEAAGTDEVLPENTDSTSTGSFVIQVQKQLDSMIIREFYLRIMFRKKMDIAFMKKIQ